MNKLAVVLIIALFIMPTIHTTETFTPVYVYGDLNGYAFRNYVTEITTNYTTITTFSDVPQDARSLIVAPMDRNDTTYNQIRDIASHGTLVIILVDDNHTYDKRLDFFNIKMMSPVNETVEISKLPLSARSVNVPKIYASGVMFNATFATRNVLIPGRYNGTQDNSTAFAMYKKYSSGRIVFVSENVLNNTANVDLFKAIYRTLYRIPYPYVKSFDIKSLAVAPPGETFTVDVVNASTFDLNPYYKTDVDISVKVQVYRYSNKTLVTTLVLTYDDYKKAYFFPATDFGGKRGVFLYNLTVAYNNGTEIFNHTGIIRLAADNAVVIGYMNVSTTMIQDLRSHNYVAFQVNSTEDLTQYKADTLLVGETLNGTALNMTKDRYSSGGAFIGVAGNRSSEFYVTLGENRTYTNVTTTERLGNVSVNLTSAPYLNVSTRYHVPLVTGDGYELVTMVENGNGGKAIIASTYQLIDPNTNLDLLLALINDTAVHRRLNVTYRSEYVNGSLTFYFYVHDQDGNPINVTFVFATNADYKLIDTGVYEVIPHGNFTISFYQPGYGYKTINVTISGTPEVPGIQPGEHTRSYSSSRVNIRTFVAFIIIVAIVSGALYVFKKK